MTPSTGRRGPDPNPRPEVEAVGNAWAVSRADRPEPPGESGLIVMVPAAETVVGPLRRRFDPAAETGVGAHVTVLYPFVPANRLDRGIEEQVAAVAAGSRAFDLQLRAVGRFPGVVYLTVEPEEPIRELTAACVERWPDRPPYGGVFDRVVPHLTVGHGEEELAAATDAAVTPHLPLSARIEELSLVVFDGERWRVRRTFPLGE